MLAFKFISVFDLIYLFIAAEQFLGSIERNKNYVLLLLYAIDKGTPEISVRISAAITFKNFVKRNWLTVSNLVYISILY